MPTFSALQLVSLAMAALSLRALARAWRGRRYLFAEPIISGQLSLLVEIALFLLVPLGVLLHEVGHMVAVWLAGGRVTGFGYLLFLGWVEYIGVTDPFAHFWIALSGNLVSVALGIVMLIMGLLVKVRRPVSVVLLASGGLILATTLVFYPALDLVSGLYGDWMQLYSAPWPYPLWLGIVHGGLLLTGVALWRSRWLRWRVSERIGIPWRLDEADRRVLAWRQLAEAAERLGAEGSPLTVRCEVADGMPLLELRWEHRGRQRLLRAWIGERADMVEAVALTGEPPTPRASWRAVIPENALFVRPSPLVELLRRLQTATDALELDGR
uniref:M50 family peptidase n=1 Tax=Thermomicrobium roseum TaxID=500 RepID=A0A7C1K1Q4_THERO